jgi:hypothetical protein
MELFQSNGNVGNAVKRQITHTNWKEIQQLEPSVNWKSSDIGIESRLCPYDRRDSRSISGLSQSETQRKWWEFEQECHWGSQFRSNARILVMFYIGPENCEGGRSAFKRYPTS